MGEPGHARSGHNDPDEFPRRPQLQHPAGGHGEDGCLAGRDVEGALHEHTPDLDLIEGPCQRRLPDADLFQSVPFLSCRRLRSVARGEQAARSTQRKANRGAQAALL